MPEVVAARTTDPQAEIWMNHALELARQGEALASPNPMVGAVAVQEAAHGGRVVGEGFHTYAGLRHAEIVALQAAGAAARRSTSISNLAATWGAPARAPLQSLLRGCVASWLP